jgi:hypothetical protein
MSRFVFVLVRGLLLPEKSASTFEFGGYYPVINSVAIAVRVSASLPAEDVAFLDTFRRSNGLGSRSAVLHLAIYMLQGAQLTSSYEAAWAEWADTPESVEWAAASTPPDADPESCEPI